MTTQTSIKRILKEQHLQHQQPQEQQEMIKSSKRNRSNNFEQNKFIARTFSSAENLNSNSNKLNLKLASIPPTQPRGRHRSNPSKRLASTSTQSNRRQSRIIDNSNQSASAIDVLRKLILARWDPVTKLLDLTNLARDKILKAAGIPAPGQKGAPLKTAGAIWKLCQEICPTVRSISLAENQLQTLHPMSMNILVNTLPDLANLSLAGNRLKSFNGLNSFSSSLGENDQRKQQFNQLRELILTGNPIRINAEKEGPTGLQSYLFEACRRFPSLEVLDGEIVDPAIKANLQTTRDKSSLPLNDRSSNSLNQMISVQPALPMLIQPAFFDDMSTSTFVTAFCLQFFNAFDNDRASLIDVYATQSSFSLAASPSIPARSKAAGLTRNTPEMPAQQVPSWNEYINISRNNAKLKGPRLCERLANGPAQILKVFQSSIPRTKHPLNSIEDQPKFIVDAWQMPGLVNEATSHNGAVIYLSIHGQYQEFPGLSIRSFDRTFVLGAAGPASAAALKGWPCVILTDQLTVRAYSSPVAWAATTNTTTTTTTNTTTSPTAISVNGSTGLTSGSNLVSRGVEPTDIEKNELIKQLKEITKLNYEFSVDCLTQNHWNLQLSIKNFNEILSRGGLPNNAFV